MDAYFMFYKDNNMISSLNGTLRSHRIPGCLPTSYFFVTLPLHCEGLFYVD